MDFFEWGLFLLATLFLLGSIDDLFLDLIHTVFNLRPKKVSLQDVIHWNIQEEDPIAVMIPAWQEYDVLEPMVRTNLKRLHYKNFHWFIGVYPNDEKTTSIALRMQEEFPNKITVVINNLIGPTSKAQMLNRILSVMQEGISQSFSMGESPWIPRFVAIHDAEDVIHPLSFKAINAQDKDMDFIQVPIFSLPVPTSQWVAGTYLDEFADIHMREIPVRQKLRMPIPSAGVGTFFSYRILEILNRRFGDWFDEGNLTEDYEVSMKIARLGGKQQFLMLQDPLGDMIATREYFPSDFGRSVRQKIRWTTGIGLQTMMKWGDFAGPLNQMNWKTLMGRWALWRDRKALWSNPLVFIAWTLIAFSFVLAALHPNWMMSLRFPSVLLVLMYTNMAFFALRLLQRARFTTRLYGIKHGILSVPRLILGCVINGIAALKAIKQYGQASKEKTQDKIEWDKTDHSFPTEEELDRSIMQ